MSHIHSDRIILREYRAEDFHFMRNWVNNAEITNHLSDVFLYPQTVNQTQSFLNGKLEGTNGSKGFVIAAAETLEYIGQIDLHHIDWKNRCAVLGIVIGRDEYLGQGIGQEAIGMMQNFVFHSLNLNRLELEVNENNARAYQCYLKCGFIEEGRLRKKLFQQGQYFDVIQMGILKEEYEQMRGRYNEGNETE